MLKDDIPVETYPISFKSKRKLKSYTKTSQQPLDFSHIKSKYLNQTKSSLIRNNDRLNDYKQFSFNYLIVKPQQQQAKEKEKIDWKFQIQDRITLLHETQIQMLDRIDSQIIQ